MPPAYAHFNGSVNQIDAETVMLEIVARVPSGLRRIPDGETGDRASWVFFQLQKFLQSPWFVPARPLAAPAGDYPQMPLVRLAEGADPADMKWPDLGYADAYLESYAIFKALRDDGVLPAGVRFQVQYPTPLASVSVLVTPEQQEELLWSYEQAVFADLEHFLAAVPHADVAVQWDVAVEFGILEENSGPDGCRAADVITARLARCVDQVPRDVPVGLHLCYGDYRHQRFRPPESLALQVRVLNGVSVAAWRILSFASFTVPQSQRDAAYFAPLAGLTADPDIELNFAVVPYHPADQLPGTRQEQVRLIDAALAASPDGGRAWGVCTECGMGRVEPGEIPDLLDLHREIIAAG